MTTAEGLETGAVLPEIELTPSARDLVLFAAGSGDFNEIHYNREAALAQSLPDVIVHGRLKAAYLTKHAVRCVADSGNLVSFDVRYRGVDLVDRPMRLGGTVRGRSETLVLELWIKNENGVVSTTAVAEFNLCASDITDPASHAGTTDVTQAKEEK